ncbi:4Fe-4S binding protein [Pseudoflavonifractor phocaeensis]|uniref:4Fe-4S binding protein n=1 Tax=Pseudoflavonifractor phocaeensis TaxID=1870988 RepID=UPI00195C7FC9|nr:4Fe-4S binding protein [Pseudoflavonifractor phocaeensis]MBM6869743.1 4Fe-4S binding protein [Pseudoflavonifractor phocaeensis]
MAEGAGAAIGPTVAEGLWYFSPTGTGRAVAEGLEERFPGLTLHGLTTPEERAGAPRPEAGDRGTLIFPVYANGVPELLLDWLEELPVRPVRWVLIAVYGSVNRGQALEECARAVTEKGGTVVGAAALPGPHCYDCVPGVPKRTNAWDWLALEAFYRDVKERERGICLPPPGAHVPQRLMAWLCAPPPKRGAGCTGCGSCAAVCPTGGRGCIRCGACARACPTGAKRLVFRTPLPLWYIRRGMAEEKTAFFQK